MAEQDEPRRNDDPDDTSLDLDAALLVEDCQATVGSIPIADDEGHSAELTVVALEMSGTEAGAATTRVLMIPTVRWDGVDDSVREAAMAYVTSLVENEEIEGDGVNPQTLRWDYFTARLASAIDQLDPGENLVLEAPSGQFVQIAVQHGEIRVESVSKQYEGGGGVTYEDLDELEALGWNLPTHAAEDDAEKLEGSPNHWLDLAPDTDAGDIAGLLTNTLRLVHDVDEPEDLAYQSFNDHGARLLLPALHLSRAAPAD